MPELRRGLSEGTLTIDSPLVEVSGIGIYLEGRLRRALRSNNELTLRSFVRAMHTKTPGAAKKLLYLALQNARGNQCVSTRIGGVDTRTYHVGDVNARGYMAAAAVLNVLREPGARYGVLEERLPERSAASKLCGCQLDCEGNRMCTRTRDGACVPRGSRARGFVAAPPLPDQRENASDEARVRRRSRVRRSPTLLRDPDSRSDVASGHGLAVGYSRRGTKLWRRPSARVRLPLHTRL